MISCRSLWLSRGLSVFVVAIGLTLASLAPAQELVSTLGDPIAHVSPGGIPMYRTGKFGHVNVELRNPTNEPKEMLVSTFFLNEPTLQYGRRAWLPPKSKLQTWHPIRLPLQTTQQSIDIRSLVMDTSQEREVLLRSDIGFLQLDGNLRVSSEDNVTGVAEGPNKPLPRFPLFLDEEANEASDVVITARLSAQQTRRLTYPTGRHLPPGEEGFETFDHLVLAENRVADDNAGLTAMRRWLFGGGNLWVMLDRVDPRVLDRLLGDQFVCEVVDRVGLTTVRLTMPRSNATTSSQDYETPVEFVRVAVSNANVIATVDGWPAAIWKTCGEGRLLVTTLGPRGWVRPRTAEDNISRASFGQDQPRRGTNQVANFDDVLYSPTKYATLEPLEHLALEFFRPRQPRLLPEAVLEPVTQEYVGYAIPSRTTILGLLLGFSVLLMGLGAWLWRLHRLELLGAIGPGIALAISVVLVLLGRQQRNAIPPTVANLQFIQTIPGTDDVRIAGVAGVFNSDAGTATINAQQGGWLLPDAAGLESTTRRMVWTDLDHWQWEHLPESAGTRSATFQSTTVSAERFEAHAEFGPDGLAGHLHLPGGRRPSDAIVATRDGRFGVELGSEGAFAARADHVLSSEQFLAAGLLSDEQDRRRRLLQKLLENPQRLDFPEGPHLLAWTEPWDAGFQFGDNRRSLGAALLCVPLKLQRPASGTKVRLAPPLLPYRAAFGPDGSTPTGWWDALHRQWIEKSQPAEAWLRFQIPQALLPIAVERARVTVRVKGPVGKLALAGHQPSTNAIVPLKTWVDPVGTLSLDITDADLLSVSNDGGLLLRLSAGDPDRPELTKLETAENSGMIYWQIESLSLELHARTIDPPADEQTKETP